MKLFILTVLVMLLAVNAAYSQMEDGQTPLQITPVSEGEEEKGDAAMLPAVEGTQISHAPPEGALGVDAAAGFQIVDLDNRSSRAAEYRSLPEGLYIENLTLNYASRSQELTGEVIRAYSSTGIINDGYWDLGYRRYGLLDVGVGLKKFPHDYGAPSSSSISTQRDIYGFIFKFTPGDRIIIFSNLSVEDRKGNNPLTVENFTGDSDNPTAVIETPEPIDYTTASIDFGMEYADDPVYLQLNNSLQVFSNNLPEEFTWDNPYIDDAKGRVKGAEDFTVHTLYIRPSIRLTEDTRLENTVSYSQVTNSIRLVPFTTAPDAGEEFIKDVIDSDVRNLILSLLLSTRPLPDLGVNVKYRTFSFKNDTPNYVMIDGGADAVRYPRIPRYTDYSTKSIGVDGAWALSHRLLIDAGIEDRVTLRTEREVEKEKEDVIFISLNSTILDNLSGRLGYTYTMQAGDYEPSYYKDIYDPDKANNVSQHQQMRAFDLSTLNSNKATINLDYSFEYNLNIGTALSYEIGRHPDTKIGRQRYNAESVSLYAHYSLFQNLNLYSEYFYDDREMESRYSWTYDSGLKDPDTNAPVYPQDEDEIDSEFTTPYSETIRDIASVYVIGFDYDMSQRLSLRGKYSKYYTKAASINLPDIGSETDVFEIKASYRLKGLLSSPDPIIDYKDLRINTGFYTEIYKSDNYAMDNIPEDGTDKLLGILDPDYRLNVFSISLAINF